MSKTPRLLLVLHRDPVTVAKLRRVAADRGFEFRLSADWDGLLEDVRLAPASASVVVDPYADADPKSGPSVNLAALLHRFPSASITAAMAVSPGRLDDVRRLGAWGVVQILDVESELTHAAIGFRLMEVRGRPLRSLIQQMLPVRAGGPARSILSSAAEVVADGGVGEDLARSLYVTRRTLTRWCRRAGLPAPRQLLAWMRILLAAELLDDPGRSVFDVALACGYASDSSLRLALRTFLNSSPTGLRDRGAFEAASKRFLQVLAESRQSGTRYRRPPSSRERRSGEANRDT